MNVTEEINKAIGVAKARLDYLFRYEASPGNFPEEEYNVIYKAICSLERWRDDSVTHNLPEIARQMIDLKQWEQSRQSGSGS